MQLTLGTIDKKARKAEIDRRYRLKVKEECFAHYGGLKCSEEGCTITDIADLELHHPDGDGNKDRAARLGLGLRSPGGYDFYLALKRAGYPPGYIVKCRHHHDIIHGRYKKETRMKCAPGEDESRVDETMPF